MPPQQQETPNSAASTLVSQEALTLVNTASIGGTTGMTYDAANLAQSAAAKGKRYTVKSGDSLGAIVRDHAADISISEIARINGIVNINLIVPGQVLWLPASAATGQVAAST